MSNLTYNPNPNIPYNSNSNTNMNMEFDNYGGNFKQSYNDEYDNIPSLPQTNPRENYDNMQPPRQRMRQRQPIRQPIYDDYEMEEMPKRKTKKQNVDKFETKSSKIDWLLFGKKIIIYTSLFLVISHIKTDQIVCKFIPFLNNNQILCMTFKGIILSIIIILIQMML